MNGKIQTRDRHRENVARKSARLGRGEVGMAVLAAVGAVGLLTLALAAPNAVQLLRLFKKNDRRYRTPAYVSKTVARLHRQGWIQIFVQNGEQVIRLTERGQRELLRYQLKKKRLEKRKWDGKWRLLIFDIKERRRSARDRARQDMITFGFVRLQDSAWVYPYECEEVVTLLKAQYRIGREMLYLVTDHFEGDEMLRKKFEIG